MKKFLCSMYLALSLSGTLQAIPVWPEPFQVQQADGTILTLNPRGDEWFSYFETTDGFRVIRMRWETMCMPYGERMVRVRYRRES